MAANAKLSNSVNWHSMKTNFCLKIFFNIYSLPSNHENHICYGIKAVYVPIVFSPEPRFKIWSCDPSHEVIIGILAFQAFFKFEVQ